MTAAAKQKHTPGPWFATPTSGPYGHISSAEARESDVGGDIATTWGVHGDAKADARLIAAAPDMLEALKYARDEIGKQPATSSGLDALKQVDAAIAKATA